MPRKRPLLSASERRAFGAFLKRIRQARKLSVHAVAIELAKTAAKRPTRKAPPLDRANASQVRAWEAGSVLPSEKTLTRLAPLYRRSPLDLFIKSGYLETVLPIMVGLLKDSRIKRLDRPFSGNTMGDLTDDHEPPSTLAAMWLAFQAFPSSFDVPSKWYEIPPHYHFVIVHEYQVRRPTRLPRLITSAMKALRDPLVKDPVRRRNRAAEYFLDWLLHFEPALYHMCFPQTSGDNEDNDR